MNWLLKFAHWLADREHRLTGRGPVYVLTLFALMGVSLVAGGGATKGLTQSVTETTVANWSDSVKVLLGKIVTVTETTAPNWVDAVNLGGVTDPVTVSVTETQVANWSDAVAVVLGEIVSLAETNVGSPVFQLDTFQNDTFQSGSGGWDDAISTAVKSSVSQTLTEDQSPNWLDATALLLGQQVSLTENGNTWADAVATNLQVEAATPITQAVVETQVPNWADAISTNIIAAVSQSLVETTVANWSDSITTDLQPFVSAANDASLSIGTPTDLSGGNISLGGH